MSNISWILICAGLVFLMQPGFMCLESGLTRTKNSINVAVKNLSDFGISSFLFWFFGFGLMFGSSYWGWLGLDKFLFEFDPGNPWISAFFLFEAMFCSTAITIVSGAVAERLQFGAYGIIVVLVSGLIYPLFGHWVWNGVATGEAFGWLRQLGFVDFAGATVVHGVGAWVSLAALLVIGPRTGRFSLDGKAQKIHGSNLPISVLGAMLLWFGWFGFNGGSTLAFDERVAGIILNTVMSGVAGMLTMMTISRWRTGTTPPESLINGSIAGLVAITASSHVVSTAAAVLIGGIGSVVATFVIQLLEHHRVDDAVDAIAVHGGSGAWGVLAVALFGKSELIGTGLSPVSQLFVQLLGLGVCFAWAFGIAYLLLRGINRLWPLRVSVEDEEIGLNYAEHRAKTDAYELLKVMDKQSLTKDFSLRVPVDRFTEMGHIATRYNQVMASLEGHARQLEDLNSQLEAKVQARTAELAEANEELKQLDQLKDQFLANTSHELRTPLNGIIGIAESLIDGITGALPQSTRANLGLIVVSGRRLSNLINDILDFSTLQHRQIKLNLRPVALRTLTDTVLALSQGLVLHKKVQLVNEIPADLPRVRADENRLQQILQNLLGNAIKFTQSGKVAIAATESLEPPEFVNDSEKKMVITVSDTGIGIPEDKLDRIFGSFEQADGSVARQYGGTGLGLAISQQLIEAHGGRIWVESKVGEGSQFRFTLPVATAEDIAVSEQFTPPAPLYLPALEDLVETAPDESEPLNPETVAQSEELNRRFKILIVDDEPVNLQVLHNHLSLEDYAIAQANNGQEVFQIINQGFRPDLILLDLMMPKMTGYEVTRKLRQQFSANELPILMLTAKNQVTDIIEGLETGANDYMAKPVAKNELLARIRTHLRLSNLSIAYSRFVPYEFLELLGKDSIIDVEVGDQTQQDISVLFADIRNFTALSEQMAPAENFKFINAYLARMEPAIVENGGFIDKYIGDAIMALFPRGADSAVRAAIAMQQNLQAFNRDRIAVGKASIRIGIGINSGLTMLGTVGGPSRMDGTAISDTVNLAARLESLTKRYSLPLLISQETWIRLRDRDNYCLRLIERVQVKGKTESVVVYEVFDADPEPMRSRKQDLKTEFENAVVHFRAEQYGPALQGFDTCAKALPQDTVATYFRNLCRQRLKELVVSEEWKKQAQSNTKPNVD